LAKAKWYETMAKKLRAENKKENPITDRLGAFDF
jgi:hypothetical protein